MTGAARVAPTGQVFETALDHLTPRVPVAAPTSRAGDIRRSLEGQRFDTVAEIVICDRGRLVGLLNIEDLLAAPEDRVASELMDADPPIVAPGADQEVAAWNAVQRGESSLAVVDADRRFLGLIPPRRLLEVLLWEHEEDLARLAGFARGAGSARMAAEEPVARRFAHRLPWLLVGLGGAFLAAQIVGAFEEQLEGRLILAFFVPGVVYLADAVGTQTEALIIRGLSVDVSIGRVVRRELLTGLLVGLTLSLIFFPVAWWQWGQVDVALAVSLSLLAACSIATIVAMALPWLFHRLGTDPAFGSGPLATVVQDLLSILLYFQISISIVGLEP
jgi:magnesium transporter